MRRQPPRNAPTPAYPSLRSYLSALGLLACAGAWPALAHGDEAERVGDTKQLTPETTAEAAVSAPVPVDIGPERTRPPLRRFRFEREVLGGMVAPVFGAFGAHIILAMDLEGERLLIGDSETWRQQLTPGGELDLRKLPEPADGG
jgi:hypothetical protein